uniref:PDZ domain-containing protein n=1 Tax=Noctiluca scintillans TaxID=2966 RepID=A0A7S1FCH4_NOCSC|mmetsp:Transcript_49746/g.131841  ORF Transcript_49746/g.131841 Transcript_49746/m.131841 type:complete len:159 (+) Transcript_49746:51-527(+)
MFCVSQLRGCCVHSGNSGEVVNVHDELFEVNHVGSPVHKAVTGRAPKKQRNLLNMEESVVQTDQVWSNLEFPVLLERRGVGEALGIRFHQSAKVTSLEVLAIRGGLVEEWNQANPHCPVLVRDRLVEANGVRDTTSKDLILQLQNSMTLHLIFKRRRS